MSPELERKLRQIRLSGFVQALPVRNQEAINNHLAYVEFLELLVEDELGRRRDLLFQRRMKQARLPQPKSLDDFDWSFNPRVPKQLVLDLATLRFIGERDGALILGPAGPGKSHICVSIGVRAVEARGWVRALSPASVCSQLLHQTKTIEAKPLLGDAAVGDSKEDHARIRDFLAGRLDTQKQPFVRALSCVSQSCDIALDNQGVDSPPVVWEGRSDPHMSSFETGDSNHRRRCSVLDIVFRNEITHGVHCIVVEQRYVPFDQRPYLATCHAHLLNDCASF